MLLLMNHESSTPLYIQIYQQIKDKIHANELRMNERLTSKRQLAQINHVSENTVMNAYNQLLVEGYIYSKERKGYFVSNVKLQDERPSLEMFEEPPSKKTDVVYDLTRSNPDKDLFPFSIFARLYRNVLNRPPADVLREADGQGLYELRVALQHYLSQSRGVPCTTDQIILGPSTESLLTMLLQLLEKKPIVGIEDPGYDGFSRLFQRFGVSTQPIPIDDMGIRMEELEQSEVDLMITTSNHQFPAGSIMPLPRRQALLEWASGHKDRYIIENDYDSEFKYAGIPIPALKYLDQDNKVVHLGSFTRVLSPGIRLSYMVLPNTLLTLFQEYFSTLSSSLSTTEQWVIRDFIVDGHFTTHLNRSRTFYKKKREFMIQAILNHDTGAEIRGEKAGLHLLVKPSFAFDGDRFKVMALDEGIRLNLLSDYATKRTKENSNTLFISFSNLPKEDIEKITENLYFIAKKCAL